MIKSKFHNGFLFLLLAFLISCATSKPQQEDWISLFCTPGTFVVTDGESNYQHCINSTSKTYHGDIAQPERLSGSEG